MPLSPRKDKPTTSRGPQPGAATSDLVLSPWGSVYTRQTRALAVLTLTAGEQRQLHLRVHPSPEHLKEIHIFHPASGGTGHRSHQGLHPVAGGRSEPTGISRCPQGLWCLCWAGALSSPSGFPLGFSNATSVTRRWVPGDRGVHPEVCKYREQSWPPVQ